MQETLDGFAARPALAEWLLSGSWVSDFGKFTLSRAADYANEISIRNVEWIELIGDGEIIITASVKGSRHKPYETSLVLGESKGKWYVASTCSCPVSLDCKHAAALLQLLQRKLTKMVSLPDPGAGTPPPARLDPSLITWLREIEMAARASVADEETKSRSREERFLAYCINEDLVDPDTKLQFALRVATRLKSGAVRVQSGVAKADPSNPAAYMSRDDLPLVSLFHQRQRRQSSWGSLSMEGPHWDELLDGALATGRLFYGPEPRLHDEAVAYRAVSEGPPEKFEAIWESLPGGHAQPMLRSGRPALLLIPTEPPRYLDREQPIIGLVENTLPPSVLAVWARGPVVRADQVPGLITRFAAVRSVALPAPHALKSETRPTVPPRPFLHVYRRLFTGGWYSDERIIGELSFTYGDSPRLPPLTNQGPREYTTLTGDTCVTWKRDFNAERALEGKLLRCPVESLLKLVHPGLLDASTRHAVGVKAREPSEEAAWIEILDSPEFEQLRQDGWTIEVDPECGLTAHDVTDFVPVIQTDSDHGIDWFRFDVSYQVDGRTFSLIPMIAEAIAKGYPPANSPDLPEFILLPCENPEDGFIRFPAKRLMEIVDRVRHLFLGGRGPDGALRMDRLAAAGVADQMAIDSSETTRSLARLGHSLRNIRELPAVEIPASVHASLRPYQQEGFRWLQFLAMHGLHGILADDMGLGKTLQTLTHLAAEHEKKPGKPSLVVSPTSVVPNWAAEAVKFTPGLKILTLHGPKRSESFAAISGADVVFTSYPLLHRDFDELSKHDWHVLALDEAQHIKNPKAVTAQSACKLHASHRICLSGTPMENHLGELWSLMRFLMPGFLGDEKTFNTLLRKPIERERSPDAQLALNRRVSPLILRRTKDQVASELPAKTEIIHGIDLNKKQADLYESVRASMDQRVREAIAEKGLAKSHIVVLDALLKLRQICCHPQLLKSIAAKDAVDSAKLDYLTDELLPTLLEEGRRILLFSQFTSMLALIEAHLEKEKVPFLKLTGITKDRAKLVKTFQEGQTPVFLISLKAGGTGLNLTAADTVIHYDPWWNPAAENQATDRAHRIGQTKPVFVHKLVCRGTIEDRILELQKHKSALVEALLSEDTSKLKLDEKTLSHLLAPLA
jgi:superfamily II DNA or RNA helicase